MRKAVMPGAMTYVVLLSLVAAAAWHSLGLSDQTIAERVVGVYWLAIGWLMRSIWVWVE